METNEGICRVMIVEDDRDYAARLTKNLSASGFDVTATEDAEAALGKLAEDRFDVVLTDIRLPGASGLDLLDRVARQAEAGEIEARESLHGDRRLPPPPPQPPPTPLPVAAVEAMRTGADRLPVQGGDARRDRVALKNILDRAAAGLRK